MELEPFLAHVGLKGLLGFQSPYPRPERYPDCSSMAGDYAAGGRSQIRVFCAVIADLPHRLTDNLLECPHMLLVVIPAHHQNQSGGGGGLAGHAAHGILL